MANQHRPSVFGANLRLARRAKGLTQAQLAHQLGQRNNSQVAKWENGHGSPRAEMVRRLATILDVEPTVLLRPDMSGSEWPRVEDIAGVIVELLRTRESGSHAPAAGLSEGQQAIGAQVERIAYLVRGLTTTASLDAVERFVIAQLLVAVGGVTSDRQLAAK